LITFKTVSSSDIYQDGLTSQVSQVGELSLRRS